MTPEQKDELLIRIDERLKSVDNKLVAHIMQSNEYRADTKKEIENINKEIKSLKGTSKEIYELSRPPIFSFNFFGLGSKVENLLICNGTASSLMLYVIVLLLNMLVELL